MKTLSSILAIAWLLIVFKPEAQAVPSYSRQTGLPCATCHFAPPELTPFGRTFTWGVTFNNNPTVEDLWNSTPAWGFPFTSSNVSPTPAAKAIINGALATDVAGIGGYAMWNEHFYFAGTVYRSQHLGGPEPNPRLLFPFNIRGFAPYWPLALETSTKNNKLEIGTYGIHPKSSPNAITGLTDSHTDRAVAFQYDLSLPQFTNDVLLFLAPHIRY